MNTTSEVYRNRILKLVECSDGLRYQGHLWDCLRSAQPIDKNLILDSLVTKEEHLYVYWDNNIV